MLETLIGYWNWNLEKSEWALQAWKPIAFTGVAMPFLLVLLGIAMLWFTWISIQELWDWPSKMEAILPKRKDEASSLPSLKIDRSVKDCCPCMIRMGF
jgi:hypothetical protein